MPYVWGRGKQIYQEKILGLCSINADKNTDATLKVRCGALVFEYPYNRLYWLHRLVSGDEFFIEARVRRNQAFIVEWQNNEIHFVQASERGALYVAVPDW